MKAKKKSLLSPNKSATAALLSTKKPVVNTKITADTLTAGNVSLVFSAVLQFEDGGGMQFTEPVYFKPQKVMTKEDVLISFRESVAALEYQIGRQISQRTNKVSKS